MIKSEGKELESEEDSIARGERELIEFKILGKPVSLPRHRSGRGFHYDPSKALKQDFVLKLLSNYGPQTPLKAILSVSMTFSYLPPCRHSAKKRESILGTLKRERPDLSNLIKFVEDALNGILWEDDAQIAEIHSRKIYSSEEYTFLEIEPIDPRAKLDTNVYPTG